MLPIFCLKLLQIAFDKLNLEKMLQSWSDGDRRTTIEGRADGIVDSSNGKVYTYIRVRPGRSDGYLKFHDDLV